MSNNLNLLDHLPPPPKKKIGCPWTEAINPCVYQEGKSYPRISVVTISYNQAQYIEETIQSVLNQNYPNLEYIIVDGGSTDGSIEIIKKYEEYLAYWVSEKDNGPANALNKGIEKCTGELFYYINSDDVLLPNKFEKVIDFINKNPKFDFYYGHGYTTHGTLEEKFPVYSMKWNLNFYRLGCISIFQQSTFIRLSKLREIGGFNEVNRTHWDGELLVDLALADAYFIRYEEHIAVFRIYPQSSSGGVGGEVVFKRYLEDKARINHHIQQKKNYTTIPKIGIYLLQFLTDSLVSIKRIKTKYYNG